MWYTVKDMDRGKEAVIMAVIMKGKPVVDAMTEDLKRRSAILSDAGAVPVLAILRTGEKEDDLAYEKSAAKRCAAVGIAVRNVTLPEDVDSSTFFETLDSLNRDSSVNGILMLRPLPEQIDSEKARNSIVPAKDVDGCTDISLAGVYSGSGIGFAPCTAEAVLAILDHYGIETDGKRAVVVGRSLVVGRPVALLLLHRNATVTICHTHTPDLTSVVREADIVVTAAGCAGLLGRKELREGQTIVDVGLSWSEKERKLVGDADYDGTAGYLRAYTPVPGGVGSVTTTVLASHVITACEKAVVQRK